MRLAIVSDIHGNLVALEAVLADFVRHAPDLIVNLGDCASSPLWPRETMELLATWPLRTVRGNHDRWLTEAPRPDVSRTVEFTRDALTEAQRTALHQLPSSLRVTDDVLAVHGTPASDTAYLLETAVDGRLTPVTATALDERLAGVTEALVLCGHSHHQHTATAGGRLIVNPGSVGCPRYADNEDADVNEAGSPYAHYAVATRRNGRWSVDLIILPYDWSAVARQARRNGRPDWAERFMRGASL